MGCAALLRLTALPSAWVALAVEAGDDNDTGVLDKIKQPVGKAPNSGSASPFLDDGEAQRKLCDGFLSLFDRLSESLPKVGTDI